MKDFAKDFVKGIGIALMFYIFYILIFCLV